MANASALVNFGTTGLNVGDYTYSLYALSAPGYLPLNSYTNSYLVSSYTALGALIVPVITPVSYTATNRALPSSQDWISIAYGAGLFVAISGQGAGSTAAASSPDGITWTARTLPASIGWWSVAYGNGRFVAVGASATNTATTTYASSPDGITWTSGTLPTSAKWHAITYGNGLFVAVADGPSTAAVTSPDGVTWTARTLPSSRNWWSIAYGNGVFVAMPYSAGVAVNAVSTDGITWISGSPSSNFWTGIGFGGGKFVAVQNTGTAAAYSLNGLDWTAISLPSSGSWQAVTYGNNTFVAVGSSGDRTTSSDGITWTTRTAGTSSQRAIAFGADKFAIVSNGPSTSAATIDYAVNATSFVLPNVQTLTGTTAYIKAT